MLQTLNFSCPLKFCREKDTLKIAKQKRKFMYTIYNCCRTVVFINRPFFRESSRDLHSINLYLRSFLFILNLNNRPHHELLYIHRIDPRLENTILHIRHTRTRFIYEGTLLRHSNQHGFNSFCISTSERDCAPTHNNANYVESFQ